MAAPVDFSGTWKETKKENFDEFGAAVGMPWMVRKMAGKFGPTMAIVQTGDHFKVTTTTMVSTNIQEFTVGEEFTFEPPKSGQVFRSVPRWEGEKLVVEGTPDNPDTTNVVKQYNTRELNGPDETILTAVVQLKDRENEVSMKRFFARVPDPKPT